MKYSFGIVLLFLLVKTATVSCKKSTTRYPVQVIGHAAAGLDLDRTPFPGNTLEAIYYAKSLGIKHLELDVQLTKDNRFVLYHADVLDLHTNSTGCVHYKTLEEIKAIHHIGHQNIAIPELLEVDFSGFNTVYLDLRDYKPCEDFQLHNLELMLEQFNLFRSMHDQLRIVVVAKRTQFLNAFRTNGFEVCFEAHSFEALLSADENHDYPSYIIRNRQISKEQVSIMRAKNKEIIIFDIKSRAGNISAMQKGPDYVMTDAISSALVLSE